MFKKKTQDRIRALGYLGYLKYKVAKWAGKPYCEVRWQGARIKFRPIKSDLETICEVARGEYSKLNYHLSVAGYPEIIIDAGAHIGLSAIEFATNFPKAIVIAIEPNHENFNLLRLNTKPYPNIIPIAGALVAKTTQRLLRLYDRKTGPWGYSLAPNNLEKAQVASYTTALSLDDILEQFQPAKISILKLDIGGAEKDLFGHDFDTLNTIPLVVDDFYDRITSGTTESVRACFKIFHIEPLGHEKIKASFHEPGR